MRKRIAGVKVTTRGRREGRRGRGVVGWRQKTKREKEKGGRKSDGHIRATVDQRSESVLIRSNQTHLFREIVSGSMSLD